MDSENSSLASVMFRSCSVVDYRVQEALSKLSRVAYIDILEGDAEGHIRFHSPEEAKAVSDARAELQKEHSWKLEILSGVVFSPSVRGSVGAQPACSAGRRPELQPHYDDGGNR